MKRILLIVSHLGANSSELCNALGRHHNFEKIKKAVIYDHPTVLDSIKVGVGTYFGEVLYNYEIQHKGVYGGCDFIYLINRPRNIPADMISYYIFRLRRIYEMGKEAGGIFLTWDDLVGKKSLLREKLGLNELVMKDVVQLNYRSELGELAYERCVYRMRGLG